MRNLLQCGVFFASCLGASYSSRSFEEDAIPVPETRQNSERKVVVGATGSSAGGDNSTFVFIADVHLGEGCSTSPTGYEPNDTDCYSVVDLRRTVARINALEPQPAFVVVGGDITASAQETEFAAAKKLLGDLDMPYVPVMGNHDIWSYDQVVGDRTETPAGDVLFAQTFSSVFEPFLRAAAAAEVNETLPGAPEKFPSSFTYPNTSVYNPEHTCNSSFQSWELHVGGAAGDTVFGDDPNFDGAFENFDCVTIVIHSATYIHIACM